MEKKSRCRAWGAISLMAAIGRDRLFAPLGLVRAGLFVGGIFSPFFGGFIGGRTAYCAINAEKTARWPGAERSSATATRAVKKSKR
jgi:hypothetical protein